MNQKLYTIKDLANGLVAVKNDGTLEELRKVIKLAWPNDIKTGGCYRFYYKNCAKNEYWPSDSTDLPKQSVKDFLKQINMNVDKVNDEFIVDCTKNTTKERKLVYKFLVENRNYDRWYLGNDNEVIVCNKVGGNSNFITLNGATRRYPNYPIYTFEQFKEKYLNMETRKLIGYKLINPKYEEAAKKLCGSNVYWRNQGDFNLGINETVSIPLLKKAGVLDIWFEPVYEEQFKEGDYVILLPSYREISHKSGDIVQLVKSSMYENEWSTKEINKGIGGWLCKTDFRKATEEEIKKAQEQIIQVVNGVEIKVIGDKAYYNNEDVTNFFLSLSTFLYPKIGSYNCVIEDITFRKSGCISTTIKYSDWKKVIDILKINHSI